MNKSELIDRIAEIGDYSKAEAGRTLDVILKAISEGVLSDDISLPGFGAFKKSHRAARVGRNPQTGAEIQISASTTVVFKAGKALKALVNK